MVDWLRVPRYFRSQEKKSKTQSVVAPVRLELHPERKSGISFLVMHSDVSVKLLSDVAMGSYKELFCVPRTC